MDNSLISHLADVSVTENGALGYKSAGGPLEDFFFRVSSYRSNPEAAKEDFSKIIDGRNKDVLKALFCVRDPRNGLGERQTFRSCLRLFAESADVEGKDELMDAVINLIPKYGRYDDLFCLMGTEYEGKVVEFVGDVLARDALAKPEESISLLAKWMPSENSSSKETKALAKKLRASLGYSPRAYRKLLSSLRRRIGIVEGKMSGGEWSEIDYNAVPSKANLIYGEAFERHDGERREKYLHDLISGENGAKMNGTVNFPYEIVSKYNRCRLPDATLESLWKNLKQGKGLSNTLVVADDSYSMVQPVSRSTSATAMDVARSLAIYCGQHCKGPYKGKVITFSRTPRFLDFSDKKDLFSTIRYLKEHSKAENTNIVAVFSLILKTAVKYGLGQDDLPERIIVVSDMEFDECGGKGIDAPMEAVRDEFESRGYKLPTLVFWNVCSRTNSVPIKENENGVILVSGFSTVIFDAIGSGEKNSSGIFKKMVGKYKDVPKVEYKKKK